jgi:hypothetical protein
MMDRKTYLEYICVVYSVILPIILHPSLVFLGIRTYTALLVEDSRKLTRLRRTRHRGVGRRLCPDPSH